MSPAEMLDKAQRVLEDRRLNPVPRAALAAAWTLLAVATKYVHPKEAA